MCMSVGPLPVSPVMRVCWVCRDRSRSPPGGYRRRSPSPRGRSPPRRGYSPRGYSPRRRSPSPGRRWVNGIRALALNWQQALNGARFNSSFSSLLAHCRAAVSPVQDALAFTLHGQHEVWDCFNYACQQCPVANQVMSFPVRRQRSRSPDYGRGGRGGRSGSPPRGRSPRRSRSPRP